MMNDKCYGIIWGSIMPEIHPEPIKQELTEIESKIVYCAQALSYLGAPEREVIEIIKGKQEYK